MIAIHAEGQTHKKALRRFSAESRVRKIRNLVRSKSENRNRLAAARCLGSETSVKQGGVAAIWTQRNREGRTVERPNASGNRLESLARRQMLERVAACLLSRGPHCRHCPHSHDCLTSHVFLGITCCQHFGGKSKGRSHDVNRPCEQNLSLTNGSRWLHDWLVGFDHCPLAQHCGERRHRAPRR